MEILVAFEYMDCMSGQKHGPELPKFHMFGQVE